MTVPVAAPRLRPLRFWWWSAALCVALLGGCDTASKDDLAGKGAEKLYAEAKDDMASGAWDRAIRSLQRVEGLAAGTLLAQQASLELAYSYWKSGEKAQALSTVDRFIKLNPSSPAFDYALYLRGLINFNDDLGLLGGISNQDLSERDQRASRDAYESFKQLVDLYPASRYAPDARLRMNYIVNSLAEYEVHVARYYYRRGAYLSAANRAQAAVNDFQRSPAAEEALYIMAQSYERLGLPELRDSADRVLRQNYPDSRYLRDGVRRRESAWWQVW